jgi:uncharacterized protein YeeX (DUF496 family)
MSTETKQIRWTLMDHIATATFPNGKTAKFDLTLIDGNNETLMKFYGIKQWLTDKTARTKEEKLTDNEKVDVMTDHFDGMIENGIEISENGVITIIGRAKSKAAGVETVINSEEFSDEERELWAKIKAKAKAAKK